MAAGDFETAYEFTFGREAGDYHGTDPDDTNPTRDGVIQETYDRYRTKHGLPEQSVFQMDRDEHKAIFREFWMDAHCEDLPTLVSVTCFDAAINSGPRRAIALFQKAMGCAGDIATYSGECDGKWGPKTAAMAYAARRDEPGFAAAYTTERIIWYVRIADKPSEINELRSWLNRVAKFNKQFLHKQPTS